jgi:hypothetical protein
VKQIRLGTKRDKTTIIDDQDFEFLTQWEWFVTAQGYVYRNAMRDGKLTFIFMQNEIMGKVSGKILDHINSDRLDNRRENLRFCTPKENSRNKSKQKTRKTSSRFKGVCWDKSRGKWISKIKVDRRAIQLGRFDGEEQAAFVYDEAAKKYFGEFAKLNFPEVSNLVTP